MMVSERSEHSRPNKCWFFLQFLDELTLMSSEQKNILTCSENLSFPTSSLLYANSFTTGTFLINFEPACSRKWGNRTKSMKWILQRGWFAWRDFFILHPSDQRNSNIQVATAERQQFFHHVFAADWMSWGENSILIHRKSNASISV